MKMEDALQHNALRRLSKQLKAGIHPDTKFHFQAH